MFDIAHQLEADAVRVPREGGECGWRTIEVNKKGAASLRHSLNSQTQNQRLRQVF